jgi:hypothetical protein
MSGFEIAGVALAIIPVVTNVFYLALKSNLLGPARAYRRQRFSLWPRILYYLFTFDADSIQELHRNINYWGADDLKAWKDSYIDSCNAIAVAASFSSQIQSGEC